MASRFGDFFKGAIGPIYFKVVNGKQYGCSMPKKRGRKPQTAASKSSANTFSMGSSLGGKIRESLKYEINKCRDIEMHNRITTALNAGLSDSRDRATREYTFSRDSFHQLNGLDFNDNSPLKSSLAIKPEIALAAGKITISFPEDGPLAKLKFPKGSPNCQMKVCASYFRLTEGRYITYPESKQITVKQSNNRLNGVEFVFDVPTACLCVISVFLNYFEIKQDFTNVLTSKIFSPSGIWAAIFTPGEVEDDERGWHEMTKNGYLLTF